MSDNPPSLTDQLANRLKLFATNLGLSQRKVARLLRMDQGQLSRFLDNKVGVSSEMALKIIRLTSLSKRELDLKFGEKISSKILHLQEAGKPMQLDGSGWVPTEDSQDDPNDTTGIDNTWKENGEPCGDDLLDTLRQIDNFHKQARTAIADFISNVQKAKVQSGPSGPPKAISDNTAAKTPGSRGDLLQADPKRLLTIYAEAKAEAEEKLQLAKDIEAARAGAVKARADLAAFKR